MKRKEIFFYGHTISEFEFNRVIQLDSVGRIRRAESELEFFCLVPGPKSRRDSKSESLKPKVCGIEWKVLIVNLIGKFSRMFEPI